MVSANRAILLLTELKSKGYKYIDWGRDRIWYRGHFLKRIGKSYIVTYRGRPNSKISDITRIRRET